MKKDFLKDNWMIILGVVVVFFILLNKGGFGRQAEVLGSFTFKNVNIDYAISPGLGEQIIICPGYSTNSRSYLINNNLDYSNNWLVGLIGNNNDCLVTNTYVPAYHKYIFRDINLNGTNRIDFTGSYTLNGRIEGGHTSAGILSFGVINDLGAEVIGLSISPIPCGSNYCVDVPVTKTDFSLSKTINGWVYTDNSGTRSTTIPSEGTLFMKASATYYPVGGMVDLFEMQITDLYVTKPVLPVCPFDCCIEGTHQAKVCTQSGYTCQDNLCTAPPTQCTINSDCSQNVCFGQTCIAGNCQPILPTPSPPFCSGGTPSWASYPTCSWSCIPDDVINCYLNSDCTITTTLDNDCSIFWNSETTKTTGSCISGKCTYSSTASLCTDSQLFFQNNKWYFIAGIGALIVLAIIRRNRR